jgi:hypothetical protein
MSREKPADEELTFSEQLLGMQGFSAARAKRYREDLEKLLVHRISRQERWLMGVFAVVIGSSLVLVGIAIATAHRLDPLFVGAGQARNTMVATCAITGLLLGGWCFRIAISGGYPRRLGDFMGLFINLLFCGGWTFALFDMASDSSDDVSRAKLFIAGGTFLILMSACVLVFFERLHRQTHEKLLRIEYHLAELMERYSGSASA